MIYKDADQGVEEWSEHYQISYKKVKNGSLILFDIFILGFCHTFYLCCGKCYGKRLEMFWPKSKVFACKGGMYFTHPFLASFALS